jgi:hypothetical protein
MSAPRLLIRKAMVDIQGRMRPCIQVQAEVSPAMLAKLNAHFTNENLFRRASYAQGFPEGAPTPSPSMAPHLTAFIKNDACPEITVKTLLAGQMQQCTSIWEVIVFEYIAQRAFDSFCDVMKTVAEIGTETSYQPASLDLSMFAADTAAEMALDLASVPAAITVAAPDGLADAA